MPILSLLPRPDDVLRAMLVQGVRAMFNDRSKGERPVISSDHALHDRGSVIWRVHGDVTTMMIGGVTALLLQMLHPVALAGVWEHSAFRDDMLGRLRRTARFIAITTYGERTQAEAAIARVRQVHGRVRGVLDDGTPYHAGDPELLAWVHVCEAIAFLDAWIAFGQPGMSMTAQDRYFAEAATVARALGADPVPRSRAEAEALIEAFRPQLAATARSREVARLILAAPAPSVAVKPVQAMLMQASIDILPQWAREMHGLTSHAVAAPIVRTSAFTVAEALRWAFRQPPHRVPRSLNPAK